MLELSANQRAKTIRERNAYDERLAAHGNGRLPRDTWIRWAGDIKMVKRAKMGVAEYIMARTGVAVGINQKEYRYEISDDLGEAVESMKAQTPASDDHLEIDERSIPIATFQKTFGWDARDNDNIENGQMGDLGRNTRVAAMQKVAIALEKLFITGGRTRINGAQVRGITTHTAVNKIATNNDKPNTNLQNGDADAWQSYISAGVGLLEDNNADLSNLTVFCNSADWASITTKPYSTYNFNTVADFVRNVEGVGNVVTSSYIGQNNLIVAVVDPTTMVTPVAWQLGVRPITRLDQDDDYRFKAYAAMGFDIFQDDEGNSSVALIDKRT